MISLRQILPMPGLTLAIAGLLVVLAPRLTPGSLAIALILAVAIPQITRNLWPNPPKIVQPVIALQLGLRVLADIVIANFHVARLVLGPQAKLRPAFIDLPLDLADPFVATILGGIISLTPGTVTIDIDLDSKVLHLHALSAPDPEALIADIKSRYETPLKEFFGC